MTELEVARRPGALRGTGFRHASFLATRLARGDDLLDAARAAQGFVASRFGG